MVEIIRSTGCRIFDFCGFDALVSIRRPFDRDVGGAVLLNFSNDRSAAWQTQEQKNQRGQDSRSVRSHDAVPEKGGGPLGSMAGQ